jgi:hypothetical protein
MLISTIREFIAEEEEVQLHMEALESLLRMRFKQLQESLNERIKRAQTHGNWMQLSLEECAGLHEQEKVHLQSQFDIFLHELNRTKRKLASLKQAEKRVRRMLAEEAASQQKHRH